MIDHARSMRGMVGGSKRKITIKGKNGSLRDIWACVGTDNAGQPMAIQTRRGRGSWGVHVNLLYKFNAEKNYWFLFD